MKFLQNMLRGGMQPFWAMLSQVITSAGNFVTSAIVVRELGLQDFGRFSVALIISIIVRNIFNGVLLVPMSVITPKLQRRTAVAYRGFLAAHTLTFAFGSSLLLFMLAKGADRLFGWDWFGEMALALTLANFASCMADFFRRYEFSRSRSVRACSIDGARFAVQLGMIFWASSSWGTGLSTQSGLLGVAAGGIAGALLGAVMYGTLSWNTPFARVIWKRHSTFIRWMLPSVVLEAVQANAPLFIGGAFLGEAALGGVRAVQQLANILSLPTNALQQVAPTMAARAYRGKGIEAMIRLLVKLSIAGFCILLAASAVVIVGWNLISNILFKTHSIHLFYIVLLYCVVNASSLAKQMLFVFYQCIEEPKAISETALIGGLTAVAGVVVLIRPLGDYAIPIASLLAATATIAFLAIRVGHTTTRHRNIKLLTRSSLA